jgi:hypothetical protein
MYLHVFEFLSLKNLRILDSKVSKISLQNRPQKIFFKCSILGVHIRKIVVWQKKPRVKVRKEVRLLFFWHVYRQSALIPSQ